MQASNREAKRMAQLDGLRALAVLAVLIYHFLPLDHPLRKSLPWGEMGVNLFFVLSGFLITSILLRTRAFIRAGRQTAGGGLRQFYARRILRIFPVFFATLFLLALCDYPDVRASLGWHFSYLSNGYFVLTNSGHGRIAHFWTLAVEEQFYLAWPCLLLFTPRRWLMPLVLTALVSSPVFRLAASLAWPGNYLARLWLPFACLDTLGAGAFLALVADETSPYQGWRRWSTKLGLVAGGPLFLLALVLFFLNKFPLGTDTLFLRSAMGLFFLWVIDRAAAGFTGPLGRLLEWRPLVYVGMISYGIYVIHFFMPELVIWTCTQLGLRSPLPLLPLHFALSCVATLLLASISWYLLEKPLNDLKRYFPYAPAQPAPPARGARGRSDPDGVGAAAEPIGV